jgi:hypothetical protein
MFVPRFFRRGRASGARSKPHGPGPAPVAAPGPDLVALVPDRASALGDEVDAIVNGHLVAYLVTNRWPVPTWAVLNAVAHATEAELAALAHPSGRHWAPGVEAPNWRQAQSALASKLLTGARVPGGVAEIQRTVLVPLESWLAGRSRPGAATAVQIAQTASNLIDDLLANR